MKTGITTGLVLKDKLGLSELPYVSIVRVLTSAYKTYLIFFNSRLPNVPITNTKILSNPMPSMLYQFPFKSRPLMGPPCQLKDFNGPIEDGMFFVIDLAGYLQDTSKRTRVIEAQMGNVIGKGWVNIQNGKALTFSPSEEHKAKESYDFNINNSARIGWDGAQIWVDTYDVPNQRQFDIVQDYVTRNTPRNCRATVWYIVKHNEDYFFDDIKVVNSFFDDDGAPDVFENFIFAPNLNKLIEGLLISDIQANAVSDMNKKFLNLRRTDGTSGSYLKDANWVEDEDSVYLMYHANPTYDKQVTNYSASGAKYSDNKYLVQIQFENVSKVLGDKETFKTFTAKEQGQLVLQMIDECEVRLFASDPSFLFQSAWEYLDEVGAAIYPLPVEKGRDIWAKKHTGTQISGLHVTKHLSEILPTLKANYQDIASRLRS